MGEVRPFFALASPPTHTVPIESQGLLLSSDCEAVLEKKKPLSLICNAIAAFII